MKTNYLKYLTIPIMVCITSTFFIQIYFYLYAYWFNYDFIKYFSIIDKLAFSLLFSFLTLFVGTLIFSIAYKQTRLTLHNVLYILAIALLAVLAFFILKSVRIDTPILIESLPLLLQGITIIFFEAFVVPISILWAIAGIGYLYAKINKLRLSIIGNKLICILYIGLLMSLSLYYTLIVNIDGTMELAENDLLLILITTISLIIFVVFCYAWLNSLLASKDTAHYPVKITCAFSLNILLLVIIFILLLYISSIIFKLLANEIPFRILVITGIILILYMIGIFLFMKIRPLSSSCVYQITLWLLYIIPLIAIIIIIPIYNAINATDLTELIFAFAFFYGLALFLISLSLYVLYITNKWAINLIFKANNNAELT